MRAVTPRYKTAIKQKPGISKQFLCLQLRSRDQRLTSVFAFWKRDISSLVVLLVAAEAGFAAAAAAG